ncbi:MAG TPA: rhodanese-like domain-containing protein [Thermoanaerobaculia bacterium]|nr:rhodanese-like domain-containing protein [Thermoanaerobaculia bacterium]
MSRAGELWARTPLAGRLALLALTLGAGAFVIGDPGPGSRVTLDTQELATLVQAEVDHVTPEELAAWLVEGRADFRLVDLRREEEAAAYRIPGAEAIQVADLPDAELPRNEKLVLYSAEGLHSAQAWMLLKAQRHPAVYILLGGLEAWKQHVLYPVDPGPEAPVAERAEFAKAAEIARHFGGAPRAAAGGAAPALVALPVPVAPRVTPPVGPTATAGAKRRKEGC